MLTSYAPKPKNSDEETKKKIDEAYNRAKHLWKEDKRIEALKSIEKTISVHRNQERCFSLYELEGDIYFTLAKETSISEIRCVYLLASIEAFSASVLLCRNAVRSFRGHARSAILLGDLLMVTKFYEKALVKAKRGLAVTQPRGQYESEDSFDKLKKQLQDLMNLAETKLSAVVTSSDIMNLAETKMSAIVTSSDTSTTDNQMVLINKEQSKAATSFDPLKTFWVKLDDKTKREFLLVNFASLIDYIKRNYGAQVKEDFEKCVSIIHDTYRWKCWKCYICSQVNYCFTDCKMHFLDNHVHKFEPKLTARPKCVDMVLADMISSGDWKPVDTAAAANLIKERAQRREVFVYVNGWCSDWPVAKDDKRANILKQFADVLKSSCHKEICLLPRTLWDWLIDYTEENLELPQVLGVYLDQCNFFENPQCICFLDLKHLEHILEYFRQLTTDVGASLVLKVVNEFWENSVVKERINLVGVTTYNLLLDEKLLYGGTHDQLDKKGTVTKFASTRFYEDVKPQGDKIVSWLFDCPEIDKKFVSQMENGVHNLEIWSAALRIVRGTVRKVVSYYDKRQKMLTYEKVLDEVKVIWDREDNRKNANQRGTYALILLVKCNERVGKQDDDTNCFLNVVRDVLERQKSPRFEVVEDMECISKLSTTVQNDVVKASLSRLRNSLKEKFHLIDSKILLNESMYKKLIHEFPKLSAVDYRWVVLPFVKKFLQDKLKKMMKTNRKPTSASHEQESKKRHLSMS